MPLLLRALLGLAAEPALAPTHAAIGLVDQPPAGLRRQIGTVAKHPANPLFAQDKPWEQHLDNSYPNVVHAPGDPNGDWQLWCECALGLSAARWHSAARCTPLRVAKSADRCAALADGNYNAAGQYLQFANSSDGITWQKPSLGRYPFTSKQFPGLEHLGSDNNIIMFGGGLGILHDVHDRDPSRRFKISGGAPAGCYSPDGQGDCVIGTAASPDGIQNWTDVAKLDFPPPWRPDCHTNIFYDQRLGQYIMTTRDRISTPAHPNRERVVSISRSGASAATQRFGNWSAVMSGRFPGTSDAGPCVHLSAADPVTECGQHCRSLPGCRYGALHDLSCTCFCAAIRRGGCKASER